MFIVRVLFIQFVVMSIPSQADQSSSPRVIGFAQAAEVFSQSSIHKSFEKDIEAVGLDFDSRDIILQPLLEIRGAKTREARQFLFNNVGIRPKSDLYSLNLTKPLSTGTNLQLITTFEQAKTPSLPPGNRDMVNWNLVFSQSLWRDGFGRATDLRRDRESYEKRQQLADILRSRAQNLMEFENLYWDWALTIREAELQEKNLKRSREILRWVKDRFQRSAAEKTDYLNAQALLARRELQVSSLQQRVTQSLTLIARFVPDANWTPNPQDLSKPRTPESLVAAWVDQDISDRPLPLEYLALMNEAEAQKLRAKETREAIRPELNLEASYGKNAIDAVTRDAFSRAVDGSHEISSIGIVYRTGLDLSREYKSANAAKMRGMALEERKAALESESKIAWSRLKEEIKDLDLQIKKAENLVKIQNERSNAERERYRKGRTTAFEAIAFEQEVAETEIMLWGLYTQKRKMEARARLFAL